MIHRAAAVSCLAVATALAGCAGTGAGTFPSLSPRTVEAQGFDEPNLATPAPMVADPALDARIAALVARVTASATAFDTAAARAQARTSAAKSAAEGSDPWLDAQTALGDLDVLRAAASEPVTTLDELSADRAVAGAPDYPALEAAVRDARARLAAMSARIAALQSGIAR